MYSSIVVLVTLSAFASQVLGLVLESRSTTELRRLFARQDRPTICTSECATFYNAADVCQTVTCFCNAAVATSLNNCLNCYYRTAPTSEVAAAGDRAIRLYEDGCEGVPGLPPISITTAPGSATSTSLNSTSNSSTRSGSSSTTTGTLTNSVINTRTTTTSTPNTVAPPPTQTVIRPATTVFTDPNAPATTVGSNAPPGLGNGAESFKRQNHATILLGLSTMVLMFLL